MTTEPAGFHAHDGWYFHRETDGSVKVTATRGEVVVVLHPDTWASIVASVSVHGETAETFGQARAFHGGGMRYRKRPVTVDAVRWTGANMDEVAAFAGDAWPGHVAPNPPADDLIVDTLEGEMRCQPGDWLIRSVVGEFYPCKADVFASTYEPAAQ